MAIGLNLVAGLFQTHALGADPSPFIKDNAQPTPQPTSPTSEAPATPSKVPPAPGTNAANSSWQRAAAFLANVKEYPRPSGAKVNFE